MSSHLVLVLSSMLLVAATIFTILFFRKKSARALKLLEVIAFALGSVSFIIFCYPLIKLDSIIRNQEEGMAIMQELIHIQNSAAYIVSRNCRFHGFAPDSPHFVDARQNEGFHECDTLFSWIRSYGNEPNRASNYLPELQNITIGLQTSSIAINIRALNKKINDYSHRRKKKYDAESESYLDSNDAEFELRSVAAIILAIAVGAGFGRRFVEYSQA